MNNRFKDNLFHKPEHVNLKTAFFASFYKYKLNNLQTVDKKMSKSEKDATGIIFLEDSPALIRKKIISAKTDSENKIVFDPEKKPGVSNLILIYALIKSISVEEAAQKLQKECSDYFLLKQKIADTVIEEIKPIQVKAAELAKKPELIRKYLDQGLHRVQIKVDSKMLEIKKHLGFVF